MIERSSVNRGTPDLKEEREQKKQLTRMLKLKGIADPRQVADTLTDIGIVEDMMITFPAEPAGCAGVTGPLPPVAHDMNSQSIKLAVDKVGKIVFALKNYAHTGNAEEKTKADVTEASKPS